MPLHGDDYPIVRIDVGAEVAGINAKRAMLEWVDDHSEQIIAALYAQADICTAQVQTMATVGDDRSRDVLREAGMRWHTFAGEFARLYDALPDREHF